MNLVMATPLPDATIILLATLCAAAALFSSLVSVIKAILAQQDTRSKVLSCLGAACLIFVAAFWWTYARGAVLGALLLLWVGIGAVASWKGIGFDRAAYCLSVLWVSCGIVFVQAPEFRLWNARVLPFWFLTNHLAPLPND